MQWERQSGSIDRKRPFNDNASCCLFAYGSSHFHELVRNCISSEHSTASNDHSHTIPMIEWSNLTWILYKWAEVSWWKINRGRVWDEHEHWTRTLYNNRISIFKILNHSNQRHIRDRPSGLNLSNCYRRIEWQAELPQNSYWKAIQESKHAHNRPIAHSSLSRCQSIFSITVFRGLIAKKSPGWFL